MEITSVKISGDGWLLNGSMFVPNAKGNKEREAIVEWLKTNTPEPEFTEAELAERELAKVKAEAQTYLTSTDWVTAKYTDLVVIQQVMTNDEFNAKYADVLAKRNEMRELL
jgi:FMN-dependent NADH-azoreductase